MPEYKFLGQDIRTGQYTGRPTDRTAILENGTAFSIINFVQSHGGFVEDSGVWLCQDSGGNNIFGIGYCHTTSDGLRCFFKVADNVLGYLPDDDYIPLSLPYNGWIMCGTIDPSYTGIADVENMTLQDLVLNSFTIFQQETEFYPYLERSVGQSRTAEWCRDYAPANFIICTGLRSWDSTTPVEYTGQTPIQNIGGDWTNWLDNNTVSDPSYSLGDIGYGPKYAYNPLNIRDAIGITDFAEDFSQPGGTLTGGYGYLGDNSYFDDIISLSAIDSGFLTMFVPTKTQLRNLADYMWSSDLVDNLKKLFADPMESIIALSIFPLDLSGQTEGLATPVVIGNVSTGIDMYKLTHQYYNKNMGSITINENWQNALDYMATRVMLYLPFIGFIPMSIDDVMGCTISIMYHVDLLSGDCIAKVHCKNKKTVFSQNSAVMYQHHGNCRISVPVNGANYGRIYASVLTAPLQLAGAMGANNPVAGVASSVANVTSSIMEGPEISRSGGYSGTIAGFNQMRPMLIIERLNQQLPKNYGKYVGYPSYITEKLKDLKGFTMVDAVIDNTIDATETEKQMIEDLLKEGVIL